MCIADSGYSRLTPLVGAEQVRGGCWGEYVASPVHDCVRRACRLVVRRSPHAHAHAAAPDVDDSAAAAAAATAASSPAEERKCGDGVDSACEESPAAGAGSPHADEGHAAASAAAPAATAVTDDDVVDSDDDTATSSVAADCVTESSAVTYVGEKLE